MSPYIPIAKARGFTATFGNAKASRVRMVPLLGAHFNIKIL